MKQRLREQPQDLHHRCDLVPAQVDPAGRAHDKGTEHDPKGEVGVGVGMVRVLTVAHDSKSMTIPVLELT